jgi:plastocyanin
VCCATAVAALTVPAVSQAAATTKDVSLGPPASAEKSLQKASADVNAFFPGAISVHVGDGVRFMPTGFHNVHFLGKSGKKTFAILPTGKKIAGVDDAAGTPFQFNGLPEQGLNPALFGPGKLGKTIVWNGTKEIQSGLPLSNKPKPMVVRFTKAGLYSYYCDLHPGMKGTVHVFSKSKPVPSAAADAKRVKLQVSKAITIAKGFAKHTAPANTVDLGLLGSGGVTLYGFSPSKLTVPVGTTVTFQSPTGDGEVHTATTGPGDPESQPTSYLGTLAASLNNPVPSQAAIYPSDLTSVAALTPTLHGNGFWNGGVQDGSAATILPNSSKVTFAAPGTYQFYCMIHPFMHGTITVQ